MCGIAGFVGDNPFEASAALKVMARALSHRGPDGEGQFTARFAHDRYQIGLAHRRLAIIDLASGAQPLFNEDKRLTLVCNGEIYNSAALRDALVARGHK